MMPFVLAVDDGKFKKGDKIGKCLGFSHSKPSSQESSSHYEASVVKYLVSNDCEVNKTNKMPSENPLHLAVREGDLKTIEMLLDRGADVDDKNQDGETLLHMAVGEKNVEVVELLLSRKANVNVGNNKNATPLYIAVEKGCLQIVEYLLNCGANVESAPTIGYTPLCVAAYTGSEEITKLLLNRGANVNVKVYTEKIPLYITAERGLLSIVDFVIDYLSDDFFISISNPGNIYTPLWLAVFEKHEKVVKLLLEHGAKVDGKEKYGKTILHTAVSQGCPIIVDHILKFFPDVNNEDNRRAFTDAVCDHEGEEYNRIIENLIEYGFNVNSNDVYNFKLINAAVKNGYLKIMEEYFKYNSNLCQNYPMVLHVATIHKQKEMAQLLIRHGADVNVKDEKENTPIYYAIRNDDSKMMELLLANGANVKDNHELLITAIKMNHLQAVEVLLRYGVDVNTYNMFDGTVLNIAALNEDYKEGGLEYKDPDGAVKGEIIKLLLRRGADMNARLQNGNTLLHTAAKSGYVKIVEALLEYNADVNSTRKDKKTPLHNSAKKGNVAVTKTLLRKGANINAKDCSEITALHLAVEEYKEEVVQVLLRCGAEVDCKSKMYYTPLHMAAKIGNLEIVKALVKFGANVDARDKLSNTPLQFACMKGHTEIVSHLINHGSDVTIKSNSLMDTPLDCAIDAVSTFSQLDEDNIIHSRDNINRYYIDHSSIIACEDIVSILKNHLIKIKTANLGSLYRTNLYYINSDENLSSIEKECKKEFADILKCEKINNTTVSFHDILTKDENHLAVYARNENILEALGSNRYKMKYPRYSNIIAINFTKGKIRRKLFEQCNNCFRSFLFFKNFPMLPFHCTEKIFSYLSNEDLKNFAYAFRNLEDRKVLLEECFKYFHIVIKNYPMFSYNCIEKIFSHLSDEDLTILIEVCKPTNISCNYVNFYTNKNN